MERNRLTLVVPEDGVDVPCDDATSPPPALTTQDSGASALHLVRVDEGAFPDDAA
jgi:hypothetical protein